MKIYLISLVRVTLASVFFLQEIAVHADGAAVVAVSAVVVPAPPPDADIVDDFNDQNDLNYWQGTNGAMEEISGDGSISREFTTTGAYAGSSLKLTYNLTKASVWNGFFLNLNDTSVITKNLSGYKQISFWVKGAVGGVEHLKIGLENTSLDSTNRNRAAIYVNDYLDGGIKNTWQKVTIPLIAFGGLNSFATAKTLTFVFERSYVNPALGQSLAQSGAVYIDDIRFSTVVPPEFRVDHFGDNWGLSATGGNWGSMSSTVAPVLSYSPSVLQTTPWTMVSEYDVRVSGSWQGHFCLLGGGNSGWTAYPINISDYRYLKFKLRARSSTENPKSIKLEVQSEGRQATLIVNNILTTFQTVVIDLDSPSIAPSVNKTAMKQVNIVYENTRVGGAGGSNQGAVYFDDIQFSANP